MALWTFSNGVIKKNGVPFFPLGFYYVSHYAGEKADRITDVATIGAAGFNILATPIDTADADFMTAAVAAKVDVVVEFNDGDAETLAVVVDSPAASMLVVADDVDQESGGVRVHPPADVFARHQALKVLAPKMLTYASGGYPDRLQDYIGTVDVMAMQYYPVDYEEIETVTYVQSQQVDLYKNAGHPFISNLQTFGWHGTQRYPTAAECRNMTYQALILGATGIIYYTAYDTDNHLFTDASTLWDELKDLAVEVTTLAPYLLNGTRVALGTELANYAHAAAWSYDNSLVVLAVNTNESAAQLFRMDLSTFDLAGTITELFPSTITGALTLDERSLSGTIPAAGVQAYILPFATEPEPETLPSPTPEAPAVVTDYDFRNTRSEIIHAALRKIGALGYGEVLSGDAMASAVDALNQIVKSWQNEHIFLWSLVQTIIGPFEFGDSGVYWYELGASPPFINVDRAFLRHSATYTDTPLKVISWRDYQTIGTKSDPGQPQVCAWNHQEPGRLYVYPLSDADTEANYMLHVLGIARLKDWDTVEGSGDIPVRWQRALIYALATDLADEYSIGLEERKALYIKSQNIFKLAKKADRDLPTADFVRGAYS